MEYETPPMGKKNLDDYFDQLPTNKLTIHRPKKDDCIACES